MWLRTSVDGEHVTSRGGRDQSKPGQTASKRRRVRTHRQIIEGRAQAMRWGVWTTAIFGTLGVLRVLLAVISERALRGRHGIGLIIAGSLLVAAWLQYREIRDRAT